MTNRDTMGWDAQLSHLLNRGMPFAITFGGEGAAAQLRVEDTGEAFRLTLVIRSTTLQ